MMQQSFSQPKQSMWFRGSCIALLAFGTISLSHSLSAQTRFRWPDSKIDIEHYRYPETCMGVNGRVYDSLRARGPVDLDTLHYSVRKVEGAMEPLVINATQRCLARFSPNEIPLKDVFFMQQLYLRANEDDKAWAVVERRIKAVPRDSTMQLVTALDSGFENYIFADQKRLDGALKILGLVEQLGPNVPLYNRVKLVNGVIMTSIMIRNMETLNVAVQKSIAIAKSMTEGEWNDGVGLASAMMIDYGLQTLNERQMLDSLARTTIAFSHLAKQLFVSQVGRDHPFLEQREAFVGSESARITGDYWFPASAAQESYPRRGRVTAVFAIEPKLDRDVTSWFRVTAAVMKRIKQRFPELDIVLVAQTAGFFGPLEPPPPEQEAKLLDSMFIKFRGLPGVMVVSRTRFSKLPEPDGRRVDEVTENAMNGYGGGQAILIDKEGLKVAGAYFNPDKSERDLEKMIEVLIKRAPKSP